MPMVVSSRKQFDRSWCSPWSAMAEPLRRHGRHLSIQMPVVSAEVVIMLLKRAESLLTGFIAIRAMADSAFPSIELLGWFEGPSRLQYLMRLRGETWIHGTAAPMGCEVWQLRLSCDHCRGFRDLRTWDGSRRVNPVMARHVDITAANPWYLVSNLDPNLNPDWIYGQRFCCEQLFREQKSRIFQLDFSGLRDPVRFDRLLLVVAISMLIRHMQGYALSLACERRRVDPHWKRRLSFASIGLHWMQQSVIAAGRALLA